MTTLEDWKRLAQQENRRMRAIWNAGVASDRPRKSPFESPGDGQNLAARLRPLFEAWMPPEEIAAHEQISEAAVWQALAIHLRATHKLKTFALPPIFYRMRQDRTNALRAAGLKRREVAALLGVSEWIMDSDLKRVRQQEMKADSATPDEPGEQRRLWVVPQFGLEARSADLSHQRI